MDKVIAGRIMNKWIKYKRLTTNLSQKRCLNVNKNMLKSKDTLPDIHARRKSHGNRLPGDKNMESIAISDEEDSCGKLFFQDGNHFEEEKANEGKTVDPPGQNARIHSLENYALETERKNPVRKEEKKEEDSLEEGFKVISHKKI